MLKYFKNNKNQVANIYALNLKENKSGQKYAIIDSYLQMINREVLFNNVYDIREKYDLIIRPFIDEKDLKDLGQNFRTEDVGVYKSANKKIHSGIEGEINIFNMMEIVFQIKNDESIPLLIKVAIIHYLIGYIHPFYDGNGRLSRLISCDMLFKEIGIASLQLSSVILENQKLYYEMFDVTNQIDDNKKMLLMFSNYNLTSKEIDIAFLAYRAYKNGISHTYSEYCEYLNISDVTLRNNIKLLKEKDIVQIVKRGRKKVIHINLENQLFKVS